MEFTKTRYSDEKGQVHQGQCEFGALVRSSDEMLGDHMVTEVVEVDLGACRRRIFEGSFTVEQLEQAKQQSGPELSFQSSDLGPANGPEFRACNRLTNPPTLYQPGYRWRAGEFRKYYKQSFVDPVCITITSTTLNIRWKNAFRGRVNLMPGTTADTFYFTDLREQWPDAEKLVIQQPARGQRIISRSPSTLLQHQRVETDFPEHLLAVAAILGVGALIIAVTACRFDFSDTTFRSSQGIDPKRGGGWFAIGSGGVGGGCSSLIHERVWHGGGSYAR